MSPYEFKKKKKKHRKGSLYTSVFSVIQCAIHVFLFVKV